MITGIADDPVHYSYFPCGISTLDRPAVPGAHSEWTSTINRIADHNPNDLKNINIMNHYVGMKEVPETIPEMTIFPIVVITMVVLGVLIGWKANYKWFLGWFILMSLLGVAGMYDFYLWEYDYGHSLDPKAIIKFENPDGTPMSYQPPLIGTKDILNFTAHSYPRIAAYLMFLGMAMTLAAFFIGRKESKEDAAS